METFDERIVLPDMKIAFGNNQHSGKTLLKLWFEEFEEKPTILQIEIPNPTVSRFETIQILKEKVGKFDRLIKYLQSNPPSRAKEQGLSEDD